MGFLHEGHLSLVRESKKRTDYTFVSIFVNPTQFAPNEDLTKYPRDMERDLKLLEAEGTDYVFIPEKESIYPDGFQTFVDVSEISKLHEGEFRPTHFKGVSTVVTILFNIINPHKAFFGQKDAQQTILIKRMVKDLSINTEIVICPTLREPDGLALSSRNIYLDETQRKKAVILYKSLISAKELIEGGEKDTSIIVKNINNFFLKETSIHLNYIRIVNYEEFKEVKILEKGKQYYIILACKIGSTRLIDNLLIELPV